MVQKLGIKKSDQGWKISGKYDILKIEEKQIARIENKTKRGLEMNPYKRQLEAIWLKADNMCIKKLIKKEK